VKVLLHSASLDWKEEYESSSGDLQAETSLQTDGKFGKLMMMSTYLLLLYAL
jgi:hypothetical protein